MSRSGGSGPTAVPVLIEAAELADLLHSGRPPVVADARWMLNGPPGRPDFEAGHVPGAQWVDVEGDLSSPAGEGGRHPLPDPATFEAAMRRIGVTADRLVVACDAATSLSAARLWWLLTDADHAHVRVLDGGYAAWVAAGFEVESGPAAEPPAGDFVARPGHRARLVAGEIAADLGTPSASTLVDVRAADRYAGENETIDPVAGHIPGAVSRPSMVNLAHDGRFLGRQAIAERYAGLGDGPVLYCGSGLTAAHSLLAMEHAGLTGRIYPGSWSDWITDPQRPISRGPTP